MKVAVDPKTAIAKLKITFKGGNKNPHFLILQLRPHLNKEIIIMQTSKTN